MDATRLIDLARFADASPRSIAAEVARLVNSGELAPGERLPTVRELASALGVSPATVSQAWQALARAGLIESRGRAGSFVRSAASARLAPRMRGMAAPEDPVRLDLSRGTPDPLLLPALGPALSRVSARAETGSYQAEPVIPALARVLRDSWPNDAEAIMVVDGALDAVSRTLEQVVRFGDRVVVESPGFPPFLDLLEVLGGVAVPVPLDEHGMRPDALAAALRKRPVAVLLQPRAQNPTGASMTAERAEALARVIRTAERVDDLIVIEDDHSGLISIEGDVTLGTWLPDRVVHVRSFSKSHGPDLRIAALGGPRELVEHIAGRRMLGPGWTSRMLQTILLDLLTDGRSIDAVAEARRAYYTRQRALGDALRARGVAVAHADGINLWMPVVSERSTLVLLAASGIRVAGGTPFLAAANGSPTAGLARRPPHERDFVRVTVGAVREDAASVADALAVAAQHVAAGGTRRCLQSTLRCRVGSPERDVPDSFAPWKALRRVDRTGPSWLRRAGDHLPWRRRPTSHHAVAARRHGLELLTLNPEAEGMRAGGEPHDRSRKREAQHRCDPCHLLDRVQRLVSNDLDDREDERRQNNRRDHRHDEPADQVHLYVLPPSTE
ncbi:PLP-dependent aminotransferase family protein [Agromyces marinus]|uniref:aminotransferase-like domain-containing protein n=1 Tax=Agromyces marinus TaxID=1389020 RepID=UPI0025748296|nr:aminotransferase class I/II-fold pyridoxal phosphate-dependent enzyme [Agromyces marinus]